jgi:cupin fold WbuC family metalloprotein
MQVSDFVQTAVSVFETASDPAIVDAARIRSLVATAGLQPNRRARLILHPDREDSLHEMVIALPHDSCDHPHINFRSGKSFCALSGQFAVVTFSDDGTAIQPTILSAGPWPGAQIIRLRRPTWHTIVPLEGDTVFLETIVGPFRGNQFASWFPERDGTGWPAAAERLRVLSRKEADGLAAASERDASPAGR